MIHRLLKTRSGIPYNAAALCLLVVALATRFYGLPDHALSYDEAVAANNSRGTFAEVFWNTHRYNTSPILYPIALYAIQQVDGSAFSVRLLPAAAGVLTVAVLLFLLPKAGVGRITAFLAALMAASSVEAIRHAQGVREYGVDAFLVALLIFALLTYTRKGRKGWLCGLLLIAPLVQYGLVLFGGAVLLTAWMARLTATNLRDRPSGLSIPVRSLRSATSGLLVPGLCFTTGCAASYGLTLRQQIQIWGEWGLSELTDAVSWYQAAPGDAPFVRILLRRVWELFCYHLPGELFAVFALTALSVSLLLAVARKLRARTVTNGEIPLLCVIVLVVMVGASALDLYALGAIRQSLFLGPVLFVAIGHALEDALTLWRPNGAAGAGRLRTASTVLTVGVVAAAGANALVHTDHPYADSRARAEVLARIGREVQDDDVVYISKASVPIFTFYNETKPDNYHYGEFCSWGSAEGCVGELSNLPLSETGRLWLVLIHNGGAWIHNQLMVWKRCNVFRSLGRGRAGLYVSRRGLRADELALSDDQSCLVRNRRMELPGFRAPLIIAQTHR